MIWWIAKGWDRTIEIARALGTEVLIQKGIGKGSTISQGLDNLN